MTATVLPGSDGQACWRFTITDGQHKNRQFLTATGRPRLAAATLRESYQAEPEKKQTAERERYQAEPEKKQTADRERYKADPEK